MRWDRQHLFPTHFFAPFSFHRNFKEMSLLKEMIQAAPSLKADMLVSLGRTYSLQTIDLSEAALGARWGYLKRSGALWIIWTSMSSGNKWFFGLLEAAFIPHMCHFGSSINFVACKRFAKKGINFRQNIANQYWNIKVTYWRTWCVESGISRQGPRLTLGSHFQKQVG